MPLSTRTCCSCSIVAPASPPRPFLVRMTQISLSRVVVFSDLVHFDLNRLRECPQEMWSLTYQGAQESQRWWEVASSWDRLESCVPTALAYAHRETLWTSELSFATGSTWIIFPCCNWDPFDVLLQCNVQWTPVDWITSAYLVCQNRSYGDIIYCYKYQGGRAGVNIQRAFRLNVSAVGRTHW